MRERVLALAEEYDLLAESLELNGRECPSCEAAGCMPRHRRNRDQARHNPAQPPSRRPQSVDGAAGSGGHTATGRKASARRTGPSRRCHQHDSKERSSSPVTALPSSEPCTLQRWSGRHRCRASVVRHGCRVRPRAGWPGSCPGSAHGSPAGLSASRRAVWISNARTIRIQHGASEPRPRAGRWPARLLCQERDAKVRQAPNGRNC